MNIQQLRYFEELCRCGSFLKAAESLYISQQGLSMSISRLENEFSCKFFRRSQNGLVLTSDGEYFRQRAQEILHQVNECEKHFGTSAHRQTTIRIAVIQGVLAEFGAEIFSEFQKIYPQRKLHVREYTSFVCDEAVENEKVDIGLGLAPFDKKKFESTLVYSRRLCLIVHRTHPLASKGTIPLSLVAGLPMVTVDEHFKSAEYFIEKCKKLGYPPDVRLRVGEVTAIHRLIAENTTTGLAGLSVESVADDLQTPDVCIILFEDPGLLWNVHIFRKRGAVHPPAVKEFEKYVISAMRRKNEIV